MGKRVGHRRVATLLTVMPRPRILVDQITGRISAARSKKDQIVTERFANRIQTTNDGSNDR